MVGAGAPPGLDIGAAAPPGLDVGAAAPPGLDVGAAAPPGLDVGAAAPPGLDVGAAAPPGSYSTRTLRPIAAEYTARYSNGNPSRETACAVGGPIAAVTPDSVNIAASATRRRRIYFLTVHSCIIAATTAVVGCLIACTGRRVTKAEGAVGLQVAEVRGPWQAVRGRRGPPGGGPG